jgi:hypothetical protein
MDKRQERDDKAIRDLRENAARFISSRRHQMGISDDTASTLTEDLLGVLLAAYYTGTVNGCADEQEHHKAIGGCPR